MSTENIGDSASERAMAATSLEDGGPAYPARYPDAQLRRALLERRHSENLSLQEIESLTALSSGMSLRDWFAGQALAGWVSDPSVNSESDFYLTACHCYKLADAMLKARKEQR